MTPFIIADIGSNHRGQLDLALKAVECAKSCGADAVKYQYFRFEDLYGVPGEMPLPFQADWLPKLADAAAKIELEFMVSAFSPAGVGLVDRFVKRHKLASSEFCHVGIIDAMIATGKSIIASTGGHGRTDVDGFLRYVAGRFQNAASLTLLECVALYPATPELYDLNVIREWANSGDLSRYAGISDHTTGNVVAVAAVGAGATIFEKHLEPFPKEAQTPDSPVSAYPAEFALYCQDIREAASAMGDGIKQPRQQHMAQTHWKRRLIATKPIDAGETLKMDVNYGIYRSLKEDLKGLPPWAWEQVNGRRAKVRLEAGDSIGPQDFLTDTLTKPL